MDKESVIADTLGDADIKNTKWVEWPRSLQLTINWEKQVTHTPITSKIAQKIARLVLEQKWIQLSDPEQMVWWEISIDVWILALQEMIHNSQRVQDLVAETHELGDEKKLLEQRVRELEQLLINSQKPEPEDVCYQDNELWSITYNDVWNKVSNETWVQSFVNFLVKKDPVEQLELIKHIHNFRINDSHIALPSNHEFSWNISRWKGSKKSAILAERLNWPLSKNKWDYPTISWLFDYIASSHARKRVLLYCLYCYSAGIQLKP